MIKSIYTDFAGQVGVKPRLVRVETDNTREEVLANNFLQSAAQMGFTFQPTDLAAVSYDDGQEIFEISISSNGIILIPNAGINSLFSFGSFGPTAADIILTNPLATTNYINFVDIFLQVHLPLMNQSDSRQVGEKITFKNVSASENMTIVDFSGTILAEEIVPGGYVVLTVTDTSTAAGSFDVELPLDAANDLSEIVLSGTHNTTWSGVWASPQTGNITYLKINNLVVLTFPEVLAAGDNTQNNISMDTLLPANLRPPADIQECKVVQTAGDLVRAFGTVEIASTGDINWGKDADFTAFDATTSELGFIATTISYLTA